jgi:hypothetical protein
MHNESSKNPTFVRIPLTNDQKEQVRSATGREAEAIELSATELEERIAPRINLRADEY